MLGWESISTYIEAIIRKGAMSRMTFEQFLESEIAAFLDSPQRKTLLMAERYYDGEQDIKRKKRKGIGVDGQENIINNLPNNIIVDNRYAALVDQKTNYLLAQPLTVKTKNKEYYKTLYSIISKHFLRLIKRIGMDSISQGIGWMYVYVNEAGEFKFRRFNPCEVIPFWKDEDHTELDMVVRVYDVQGYEGFQYKTVTKVEVYHADGIKRYVLKGKKLVPDVETGDQFYLVKNIEGKAELEPGTWNRIPIIPFKSNPKEIPLLNRVKSLQDALNRIQSHFMDTMQEDPRNTILVLVNYDGEDLGEFRKNLSTYGAIKVRADDGVSGDVRTLQIEVNAENFKVIIELLRKAIITNGKGFDAKEERSGNSPNELNLKSMYSDIDLDANMTETEFQVSFELFIWFYNSYLEMQGKRSFFTEEVEIIFNRDIMISESSVITDIKNSVGILSRETLVAQHPYVDDAEAEMDKIKKEEQENIEKMDPYKNSALTGGVSDE